MTIELLTALRLAGVSHSAGASFTLDPGLEAELVGRSVARLINPEAFSGLPIANPRFALNQHGHLLGLLGVNDRPTVLNGALDVRNFGAKCDGKALYDVTATNAAASAISSASAVFTAADIGKACAIIPYTDTGLTPRWGTITGVTGANNCTTSLSAAPGALSGATFVYGTDDAAAIDAALAAAKLIFGSVFFPIGITCTTGVHVVPTGVTFEGAASFPTGGKAKDFKHYGANLVLLRSRIANNFLTLGDTGGADPRGVTLRHLNVDCFNLSNHNVDTGGGRTAHVYACTLVRGVQATVQGGATLNLHDNCILGQNNYNVVQVGGDSRVVANNVTGAGNGYYAIKASNPDDILIGFNHVWKDSVASSMLGGGIWLSFNSGNVLSGSVAVIGNKCDTSYGPHIRVSATGNSIGRGLQIIGNLGFQNAAVPSATYPFLELSVEAGSALRAVVITGNNGRGSFHSAASGRYTYFILGSIAGNVYGSVVGQNVIDNCDALYSGFTPDHDGGNIVIAGSGTTLTKSTTT